MTARSQGRSIATTSLGGALAALSGLLVLLALLDPGARPGFMPAATIALAVGAALLAVGLGGTSIVGRSWVCRIALVIFGVAPLGFELYSAPPPWSVAVGMSDIWLVTIATVLTAVAVARAGVLRGAARWALMVVAIDAVVTAIMSSVLLGTLPLLYTDWQLASVRPIALLIWGVAVALHGRWPAIRARGSALGDAWRRTTDVGGGATETETAQDRVNQR
ncbi:hypothetical protein [uncultured Amnibacterium sp.]|uniref:hypothetical protein n=1 Tax=uncultured Amnibacterium sp. TaxID=1631851 RepID=UPI0035C9E6FE